jgi:hypothetical protein
MHFQKLFADIFNAPGGDAESVSMLKKVADEYPYFSLVHFFLLQEALETGGDVDNIAPKTALHFNNPFLLNEQLYRGPFANNGFETRVEVEEAEIKTEPVATPIEEETPPVSNAFESRVEVAEEEIITEPVYTPTEKEILPISPIPVDQVQEIPETAGKEMNEGEIKENYPTIICL